ncbi:hypothetical protein ABS71_00715 [bacterium SCN 62-11]|nr:MAG: hypothetical protein ABS71_00715 [bacterium SCN 62-11]
MLEELDCRTGGVFHGIPGVCDSLLLRVCLLDKPTVFETLEFLEDGIVTLQCEHQGKTIQLPSLQLAGMDLKSATPALLFVISQLQLKRLVPGRVRLKRQRRRLQDLPDCGLGPPPSI